MDRLSLAEAAVLPADEVLTRLATDEGGLTPDEAARRLAEAGPNVISSHQVRAVDVLVRQLRNPLLILLVGAATISGFTGAPTDATIIGVIVVLSVGLGFANEYRSEQAVAALHADIHHDAVVRRAGHETRLDVRSLVPGDVVELATGDLVPADLRILAADELECDEAVLTGEAMPMPKSAAPMAEVDAPLALENAAFMGTVVHRGEGRGVVVLTGSTTSFGKIALGLGERQAETAFQVGLRGFSRLLVKVAAVLTTSIFVINVALSRPFLEALLFSLAIAIGITPQLLPAIVSVSLSAGSRRLARKKVLVKRLVTIEDLGNIEVLFTDKTGTLTEGAISFQSAIDAEGRPSATVLAYALLCNEAVATDDGMSGNPLDVAVWQAPGAEAAGAGAWTQLGHCPFDHERQLASVVAERGDERVLVTKGAPEAVLDRCVDIPAGAAAVLDKLFEEGARVVAVATRPARALTDPSPADERDLTLAGFVTFADRPKKGADLSLRRLADVGITVKLITGDNGTVAAKVCHDLGVPVNGVLSGRQLDDLDDAALAAAIPSTTVFARVTPEQKSRIVKIARQGGADVAFLGDGVNDAVALHAADVGISVESATDVAKDAADIVLLDKDLGVLADGVAEGRRIFANTLKYVLMATSSNFGNMFSAAGASLFLKFLPMLPSQILLNNLLYDVGQLSIPTDNVDPEVVARPAAWDIAFVRRFMTVFGPISSIFDFATFFVMLRILHAGHDEFRSGWFVESLATQTLVIFLIRTHRIPFTRSRPSPAMLATPVACASIGAVLPFTPLAGPLGFATLPLRFFLILLGMIGFYLVLVEAAKQRFFRAEQRPVRPPTTDADRHRRRVARRAARFSRHHPPEAISKTLRRRRTSAAGTAR